MDGSCVPRVTFRVTHRPAETLPEERALCGASGGTVADQRPTFRPPHFLDRFLDVTSALLIRVHQSRRDGVLVYDSDTRCRERDGSSQGAPARVEPPPEGSTTRKEAPLDVCVAFGRKTLSHLARLSSSASDR